MSTDAHVADAHVADAHVADAHVADASLPLACHVDGGGPDSGTWARDVTTGACRKCMDSLPSCDEVTKGATFDPATFVLTLHRPPQGEIVRGESSGYVAWDGGVRSVPVRASLVGDLVTFDFAAFEHTHDVFVELWDACGRSIIWDVAMNANGMVWCFTG